MMASRLITEILQTGMPSVTINGPENFSEVRLPENPPARQVTDNAVDALLGRGVFDRELLFASLLNGGRAYLASRSISAQICHGLQRAGSQVVIHSEIGNGKSLTTEQISFWLLKDNKRVFIFERKMDDFSYDIEYFSRISDPYVLIIEELIANEDIIETVKSQLSSAR